MLQPNSHMSPNFAQERQALDPGSALLAKRQSESGNAFILGQPTTAMWSSLGNFAARTTRLLTTTALGHVTRRTGQSTNRLACRRTRRCGTLFDAAKGILVNVEFYNLQPTASAAVYPQQLCKAILKDVKKFTAAQERASHLVCHKCSKCKLGRGAPVGTEHTLVPRERDADTPHSYQTHFQHLLAPPDTCATQ